MHLRNPASRAGSTAGNAGASTIVSVTGRKASRRITTCQTLGSVVSGDALPAGVSKTALQGLGVTRPNDKGSTAHGGAGLLNDCESLVPRILPGPEPAGCVDRRRPTPARSWSLFAYVRAVRGEMAPPTSPKASWTAVPEFLGSVGG